MKTEVINDLLGYEGLKIIQRPDIFNFSLDSTLLASFVTINNSDKKIIDLGTRNAPIPLFLSLRTKAEIYGIELQEEIYDLVKDKNHIVIANKCDLVTERDPENVYLSALTGEGVQDLKQTLTKKVCDIEPDNLEFVTNSRQQACLNRARASLDQALLAANIQELQDLISIDVKASLLALDELTGELVTDELLDNVFEHFCIGK